MRALVTGGTGFIGHHLVEALVREGHHVTALVRSQAKAGRLAELGVRRVEGDLHDLTALTESCRACDAIFHVAGAVKARNESAFLKVNEGGTRNLVQAAEAGGRPHFVLVSSLAAAGPTEAGRPLRGDEQPEPITAYGRSKVAAESVVAQSSLPWTVLRPPMVYGPRDSEFLPVFRMARLGVAPVFGDGSQELSAVFAPDLAEAILAVAGRDATAGRLYFPCHPERFRSRDFVLEAGRAQGREPRIVPLPARLTRLSLYLMGTAASLLGRETLLNADKAHEFLAAAWTADPGPFSRDTGWTASHDLREGIAQTVAWYRESGWL